ncbi:MAG: uncharacterized protein A8A55_2931 [Amphiamblys sp. WSBS2006]|nr:MAG: uncharacterized protein A8A55_2931 [Amphiamblys sp. WSBS2006]
MNQKKFLSDFLSGCRKAAAIRAEAEVTASIHSAAELRVFLCSHEENLRTAVTPDQAALFRREVKKYTFALAAKEAWEKRPSFKKMVPFPPHHAGDNTGTMKNLFDIFSEEVDITESVSVEEIKGIYPTWKKDFLELIEKTSEPSERELQVSFARLLSFLGVKETDIRQFVELREVEADIMLKEDGNEDVGFVEIKKNKKFKKPRPGKQKKQAEKQKYGGKKAKRKEKRPLVAAMYQAALYALYKAICRGKTGKQIIKIAAMSLPRMMSRLGSIEIDLDANGMLVGKGKLNIGILQIWKSGHKDQKTPAEYSSTEKAVFKMLVERGNSEEEARAGVEAFRAENLSDEEKTMDEYIKDNKDAVWTDENVAAYEFINYTRKCFVRRNP